jgi:hypothetical protein
VALGSSDPSGSCTPDKDLCPLDRRIHLDPAPLTRVCGPCIFGSIRILHPSQPSVALALSDPSGSCTPHKDPWPLYRRIHLDPAPLIRICGPWIVGSIWILHPSQGCVAPGSLDPPRSCTPHTDLGPLDRQIHLDPAPLTRICGPWIVGSIWILHPSCASVASGSADPSGSCTPHKHLWPLDRRSMSDPFEGMLDPATFATPGYIFAGRWILPGDFIIIL